MLKELVLAVASIFGLVDDTPKEYDFYEFEITHVNEDSVYGNVITDNIEEYNSIYLEKDSKVIKELKIGDEILVTFEKGCHDCIVDIKKMD